MKNIIYCLIFSFLFFSCSDEHTDTNSIIDVTEIENIDNYPEIEINNYPEIGQDGKLHFKNEAQLEALLLEFEELSLLDIYVYNERIGFESSFNLFVNGQIEDNRIEDRKFASILNDQGECYFDEEGYVYQCNQDFYFAYAPGNSSEILKFRNDLKNESYSMIPNSLNQYSNKLLVGKTIQETFGEIEIRGSDEDFFPGVDDRRLKGVTNRKNYGVYKFIRAKSTAEKRGGFLFWSKWKNLNIDVISVEGTCTLLWPLGNGGNAVQVIPYEQVEFNDDNAHVNIYFAAGFGVTVSGGQVAPGALQTTFPGVLIGNNDSFCNHFGEIFDLGSVAFPTFWD